MTRRELLASAAAAPLAVAAVSVSAAPARRQGPTMDQLINLATGGRHSAYYKRLLDLALAAVGPVAVPGDQSVALYINRGFPGSLGNRYYTFSVHTAATVLVPDSVLPHIRPENRGQDFPPGIPFRPLR